MAETIHFAVQLKRSGAGRNPDQRKTLLGLGLTRRGKTVFLKDTPAIRGMIYKVVHLVEVQRLDGPPPPSTRAAARAAKAS
jgi:large subunit ribosomal protein L30